MSIDWIETGTFATPRSVSAIPEKLRIVSWNIARGRRIDAISQFLVDANADLILLQESDCNNRRTAYRNIASELAQKLGMNYAFGNEFEELAQGSRSSPAYHGQATLSRWALSQPRIIRFRRQSRFWSPRWWIPPLAVFQRRIGGRMALITNLTIGDRSLMVYNLHLESRNSDELRFSQIAELLDDTRRHGFQVVAVLAGDFNLDITATEKSLLEGAGFENPFANLAKPTTLSNASRARRAIDWILIRGAVATSFQVHNSIEASDHYPLSLTLQFS